MESLVKNRNVKLELMNWIKTLAAFGVMISHYHMFLPVERAPFFQSPLKVFYRYGGYGVILFLGFSGYTSMLSYSAKNDKEEFKSYIWPKIKKIWPLHMCMALICFGIQIIRSGFGKDFFVYISNSATDLIANALLAMHLMTPELSLNGPAWSLSVSFAAYIIFFIVMRYCKKPEYAFGLMALVFSYDLFMVLSGNTSGFPIIFDNIQYAGAFCVGCLCFQLFDKEKLNPKKILIIPASMIALIALPNRGGVYGSDGQTLMVIWLVVPSLLILGKSKKLNSIASKIPENLKWFGDMYLFIYLCHFPIMLLIQTLKDFKLICVDYTSKRFFVVYVILVFAFSIMCKLLFDRRRIK